MNLGVSATKIIVGVLSLSEIGFGSPVVDHSAFGLAYVICTVHWLAPVVSTPGCTAEFLKNGFRNLEPPP
jgi:hypothetical protein